MIRMGVGWGAGLSCWSPFVPQSVYAETAVWQCRKTAGGVCRGGDVGDTDCLPHTKLYLGEAIIENVVGQRL